jgi:hypothetical protein
MPGPAGGTGVDRGVSGLDGGHVRPRPVARQRGAADGRIAELNSTLFGMHDLMDRLELANEV